MRIISRIIRKENRLGRNGEYKLIFYEAINPSLPIGDPIEISTPAIFGIGERVEVWFSGKYNKPKMRPYKEKRK